jgi:type I restriction-modification system DNA methylase subunit
MPIKKSELYSSLWRSCDELRGGMDASQYKDYVLVLLFVKYVSDKWAGKKDGQLEVPKGGSFADMVALKGQKDIGEGMMKVVTKLAEANGLQGVIDQADWNDDSKLGKGKEMVDRLSNLVSIFDTPALDFRGNRAEGDDLLGDAYEYPKSMDTSGRRALYDNLERKAAVALAVDAVVRGSLQDDWRNNPFKVKRVRNAIKGALGGDEVATERILELVKKNDEY